MNNKSNKLLEIASRHNLNDLSLREIGRMMGEGSKDEAPQTVKFHWRKLYEAGKIGYLPRTRQARTSIKNYVDKHSGSRNSELRPRVTLCREWKYRLYPCV